MDRGGADCFGGLKRYVGVLDHATVISHYFTHNPIGSCSHVYDRSKAIASWHPLGVGASTE
jgi:hypothetical protein